MFPPSIELIEVIQRKQLHVPEKCKLSLASSIVFLCSGEILCWGCLGAFVVRGPLLYFSITLLVSA